ncbi:fungal-specific transcription factor domain-containing protein [Thelonectria olida]|uniref:Fungal-specific transcription factor domain-containing protein n=1 Tax=Thelonectria olida TaxID=1576542 RepID=A0A9P8W149_9HYPO|nr:fungal-specific transcription factor domain-containing protein [Thelonectria olida]
MAETPMPRSRASGDVGSGQADDRSSPDRPRLAHRRGLKRNSAACERCRRRKQKCDGALPICGPCGLAGVACVPSERLVVRVDPNCECEQLRNQVQKLKEQVESLQAQRSTESQSSSTSQTCNVSLDAQDLSNLPEIYYPGRILLPTFPETGAADTPNGSFLSSPWHLWNGLAEASPCEDVSSSIPLTPDDYGLELVEVFFARRWPQFPVLHRPTFMESHFVPFLNANHKLSSFQVNMVFAIGASELSRAKTRPLVSHHQFFQAAIRDLGNVMGASDIDCIQCLLLLCIFGSNEPQLVNLWYTVGLALRLAVGIDLHRHEAVVNKSLLEAEMCKRLFWSVYTMDRSISIAMGRPLGIHDSDITMPLPLSIPDDKLTNPDGASMVSLIPNVKDMSTFLHVINLRRINADIYKALHSAGNTNIEGYNLEAIRHQYYARLNDWLFSAPRYLAPASMYQMTEWFQIAYHQAILNLYRPSHASPVATIDAIRLCADSSISLITCYSALYAKNKVIYTFVALNSLFMAAVTMLYSLRASFTLRSELTKEVAESNIRSCTALLRDISNGRAVGERSAQIVTRLGNATLAVFDTTPVLDNDVDTEFMSWFGLKCQNQPQPGEPTPSIDLPWNDLFDHGFDLGGAFCSDLLL